MPNTITYQFKALVSEGPSLSIQDKIDTESYTWTEVSVDPGTALTVDVNAGGSADFLAIESDSYDNLSYEIGGSGNVISLDGPHLLVGAGAVQLLGVTPNQFEFNNGGAEAATIRVLSSRDATP